MVHKHCDGVLVRIIALKMPRRRRMQATSATFLWGSPLDQAFAMFADGGDSPDRALAVGVSERARLGMNAFGEQSNGPGHRRVGLGESPCGTGTIPYLTSIHHCERQTGGPNRGAVMHRGGNRDSTGNAGPAAAKAVPGA
jgi:hypothetical protein